MKQVKPLHPTIVRLRLRHYVTTGRTIAPDGARIYDADAAESIHTIISTDSGDEIIATRAPSSSRSNSEVIQWVADALSDGSAFSYEVYAQVPHCPECGGSTRWCVHAIDDSMFVVARRRDASKRS